MPQPFQRISMEERIRRYLAAMEAPRRDPADPQDSHTIVFNATRALLHGFGLTPSEARPFLEDYLSRSDLPWTPGEIAHKLRQVDALQSKWPRGYLRREDDWKPTSQQRRDLGIPTEAEVRKKVEFELEKLRRIAAPWRDAVDAVWLGNRSAVDPATLDAAGFLRILYPNGEKILCFQNEYSQGEALWPDEQPPTEGRCGVWFLPQPVSGEWRPNPEGRPRQDGEMPLSRRTWRAVTRFRYFVIESDEAPLRDWLGFIVQVPLRIEALYTSGSRSVHALVRVDCPTKEAWDEEKRRMMPFLMGALMCGADRGTWSAVRLSRLPGCLRHGKMVDMLDAEGNVQKDDKGRPIRRYQRYPKPGVQKLLYVRPNAPLRPICEIPAERDVEKFWCDLAALGISDEDPTGGAYVRGGLAHYANVSERCRAAAQQLEMILSE